MVDLGTLEDGSESREGVDINARGAVTGGPEGPIFFVWTRESGIVSVEGLEGGETAAFAINDRKQVVGFSRTFSGDAHPFFWSELTGIVDLGRGVGRAINARGQVAGIGASGTAMLWTVR